MTGTRERTRKELLKYLLTQAREERLDVERVKEFIRVVEPSYGAAGSGDDPIAVVGIACRLPGASNKEEFWNNLAAGRESIGDFPPARMEDLRRVLPNPTNLSRGGFLDRIDLFDPEYFGIPPRAATELDPYHRQMLEILIETMEDAGYARDGMDGAPVGVFVGNDHSHRLSMSYLPFLPEADFAAFTGSWPGILASRLSYHLNLRGPASVTDTGCSSGLVALDSAMKAIRQGDCDSALVAGINLFLSPGSLGSETESGDRVRAFDARARGTVWSEAVVGVHVKPLARATADGDHVYGVIVGNAVNNDGRSNGITAPNARAQKEVLVKAWKRAGIPPESLSYIEAHGTGTALGDPIEVKGLKAAFGEFTGRRQFCALGSVKSNVGHTVGAAGLVSLVKTLLCLDRRMLLPSLHFEVPNHYLDLVDSPVYISDRLTEWEPGAAPRRAGVSSFSLTGTNTHVVLEEAPPTPPRPRADEESHLYVISARSESLLARSAARHLDFLGRRPDYRLDDICHTMRVGREHQPVRAVILCDDRAGLRVGLARLLRPRSEHEEPFPDGRTAVLRGHPESSAADHGPQGRGTTLPLGDGTDRWADLPERFRRHRDVATAYLLRRGRPFEPAMESGRRVPLPPQPFDHARYWDETVVAAPLSPAGGGQGSPAGTDRLREVLERWAHGASEPLTARVVIAAVWSEVLGRPEIGGSEDLFSLGGDSVSSLKIVQLLNAEFDLGIPPPLLLKTPVFDDFAAAVVEEFGLSEERIRGRLDRAPEPVGGGGEPSEYELPLTAAQRAMFHSSNLVADSVAYNITGLTISDEAIDAARLEAGMRDLVRRHDSLRATFHLVDGEPVQRVHADVEVSVEHHHLDAPGPGEGHEDRAREQMAYFVRPFRLDEGPLFRVGCFDFGDGVSCVAIDFHHIVTDGTSMGILFRDLAAIVEGAELHAPARGYRSAVVGLLEQEESEEVLRGRDYWRTRFADGVPVLDLVTDRQRTDAASGAGATLFTEADAQTLDAVKEYARARNLTPFMVLLGVFQQLLSRLSGQRDIVVGTPVHGRPDAGYADVVGMFVNTLPLRTSVGRECGVGQFYSALRSTVLEAFEHQHCPLELMIEDLRPPREPGRSPLFDTCFVYQNTDMGLEHAGERVVAFDDGSAKYDITLSARESGGRLLMEWEYSTALFREETLRLYADRYMTLLRSVLAADDADALDTLPLMPEQETALIRSFATTPAPPLEDCGAGRLFEQQAAAAPERTALITGGERIPYGELNARANRLAHHLSRQGAAPGSPVAILADRSPEMVVAVLGVLKAGCYYVPLNVEFPGERLRLMLRDSGAELVVTTAGRAEQAGGFADGRVRIVELSSAESAATAGDSLDPGLPSNSEDPVYAMYTSGTTGVPKGTVIRHKSVLRVVRGSVFYPAGPDDVFLLMSDYSFDGAVYDMFAALTNGASLVVLDRAEVLDLDRLGAAIERHGVTSFFITAAMFHALIDNVPERLGSIRRLIFGGEAASPAHVERAFRLLGPDRIANGYGPTESAVFAAVHVFDSYDGREAVPIGRPINDTSLYVLDEDLRLQPIGVPGELCIGGAGLADGYLNQPGLTAERFVESPDVPGVRLYRTGDLVTLRSSGLFFYTGRIDQQVKLRGYRIETAEIVHAAVGEPDIRWAHAAVHETGEGSRSLCLWIRYEDGAEPDEARLRAALGRRLPGYMVPSFIVRVDEDVRLTDNGKLDVSALPAPDLSAEASATPPRTEAERRVAAAWSRALGAEVADIDANFFALGGDSIKAIQIAAALKGEGLVIQAADLLDNQTVRMLAEQASVDRGEEQLHDQAPVSGPVVPSPVQQAFVDAVDDRDRVFTQCVLLTSETPLSGGALAEAVERLARFHDALRVRLDGDGLVLCDPDEERLVHAEAAPAGLTGEELTDYLRALQKRVDVCSGPAVALATGLGERGEQCALAIHHLAVDVVSWGILIEDLLSCLADPSAPLAPKSMPFPSWTAELAAHAREGGFRGQLPYWTGLARRAGAAGRMFDEDDVRRADTVSEVLRFPAAEVTDVLGAARTAHGVEPGQTILAIVARALGAWRGRDRILVTLEGHGRERFAEERDLTRTVGWFTAVFPHLVRVEGGVGDTLHAVRRSFDRLPGKGSGYGPLCRLDPGLGGDRALLTGIRPQVGVNYLGEQGGRTEGIEVTHLPAEVTVDEDLRSPHILDVIAWRSDGDLLIELRHPAAWRVRGDDRALADAVRESFRAVRDAVTAQDRPGFRTSSSVRPGVLDDILAGIGGGDRR